ncbi:IS1096 element passenger TnpR family protein [Bacillus salacetis]|uniref:IS1096 element passenger TnpR family protein n=1 Tax=Bacillus salacetis TaxID=2315464 RepID=UPI003B9E4822
MEKELPDKYSRIIVTPDYPSHIVENFRRFLTYVSTHKIKLTRSKGYFTKKDLIALQSQMKGEKREVPEHATQQEYPMLHLFYELSLVLDFIKVKRTKSSAAAIIQDEPIDVFMGLTATEQYLSLLEAFWTEADWKELQGEKSGRPPIGVDILFEELEAYPDNKEIKLSRKKEIGSVVEYGHFLYYFSYFGFWTFTISEERNHKYTIAKSITLTPFFKKIQHVLAETYEMYSDPAEEQAFNALGELFGFRTGREEEIEEEPENAESLVELLSPYFQQEELRKVLRKQEPAFKAGNYLFKVNFDSDWKTLKFSSSHTLLDVHDAIQEAFEFGGDHLYAFYMDGQKFGKHFYNAPMDTNRPYADEVQIGMLDLYEGQMFLYLFDFMAEWEFKILVLEIIDEEEIGEPAIVEISGEV